MNPLKNSDEKSHNVFLFLPKWFPVVGWCILAVKEKSEFAHKAPGGTGFDEPPFATARRKGIEEAGILIKKATVFFKEEIEEHIKYSYFIERYKIRSSFVYGTEISNGKGITAFWMPIREFIGSGFLWTQRDPVDELIIEILPTVKGFTEDCADLIEMIKLKRISREIQQEPELKDSFNALSFLTFSYLKCFIKKIFKKLYMEIRY